MGTKPAVSPKHSRVWADPKGKLRSGCGVGGNLWMVADIGGGIDGGTLYA